jgi:predicted protein tyrosine phosphatase
VSVSQRVHRWVRQRRLRSIAWVIEWTTRIVTRRLDVSRVNGQLLVGGHVPVSSYPRLKAMGITHVIDVRAERCDDAEALAALGIQLLHVPAPDRHALPVEALLQGVAWAVPRLADGAQVFCHCQHGVGRGPLMALAILVAQGNEVTQAYRTLRKVRWQSRLNDRQLAGIMRFVEVWARHSPPHGEVVVQRLAGL